MALDDRRHAFDLLDAGADFHIRETFETVMVLGQRKRWGRNCLKSMKSPPRFATAIADAFNWKTMPTYSFTERSGIRGATRKDQGTYTIVQFRITA